MTTINITVDPMDPKKVQEAIAVLQHFNTLKEPSLKMDATELMEFIAGPKSPAPKQAKAAKAVDVPPIESNTEEKEQALSTTISAAASRIIKIEDIRALLAKKVNDHRAGIKAKLTEMGAANVTTLPTEQYQAFMDYLNALS